MKPCQAYEKKLIARKCWSLLFCFLLAVQAKGQAPHLKYLGIEKGLSNNSVRCIYQDQHGFMWFGTYDGLNRFDGYEFTVYRNKLGDSASLPYNYINVITEDQNHNLWVGTGQGIGVYNNLSARWQAAMYTRYGQKEGRKITANVHTIQKDSDGNLFIGTANTGLLVRDTKIEAAIQVPILKGKLAVTDYTVLAIKSDEQRNLWVFVEEVGLCRYVYETGKLAVVDSSLKTVQCMEGNGDALWMGTKNGLFIYNKRNGTLTRKIPGGVAALSTASITSLFQDRQQQMWIGTEGDGVNIINTITGEVKSILPGDEKTNITSGSVNAIYEDRESRKWIGTLKGGINIIDPEKAKFRVVAHEPRNPNSLVNDFVYSFYEDKNRNLWIGSDGGGFSIWNRQENTFAHYRHTNGGKNSLSNNSVTGMLQDAYNNTWISTYGGGINRFDPATGSFMYYPCINDRTGKEDNVVLVLYEDKEKNLWAGTFANGKLYRFHRGKNRFEVFDHTLTNLLTIAEDDSGNLWAGNTNQLIKIDKRNRQHVFYEISKPVRGIYEDKNGNFWIGTEGGGLLLFDRKSGTIVQRFSVEDGLCNNSILKILEDHKGQLWLSTFDGLSRFNWAKKEFKNYYQSDGLQSNQFHFRTGLRLASGEFVFGGIKGFSLFFPDSIQPRTYMPPVVLTNLRINGKPVADAFDYVVKSKGADIQVLRIPYSDAVLSVDFAALEFSSPDRIAYAYYLEGWDKNWNYSNTVSTVNYTNLTEGTYTLRLRATNAEGTWNPEEKTIMITILPPWYRSAWAYLFYVLLLSSLVYLYLRYKTRQTRLEYEVRLAHLQAEKEKELNEKKLSFFTDISHEFRTPLTLIINPLKEYLQAEKTKANSLQVVYRNARRMLSLVDQLLLFQWADADREVLKINKLNFSQLCREVYGNFELGAQAKNLRYEFLAGEVAIMLFADKEKLEIILYNLLSNALKYTPDGGKICFRVQEDEQGADVFIEDSGPGIPEEMQHRLFERFYQVQGTNGPTKQGFGIGLYLVKHFMDKHKGTIGFTNRVGGGASFHLRFQKGIDHLREYPLLETVVEKTILPELLEENETAVERTMRSGQLPEFITDQKSVLVVEDDADIRRYVTGIFRDSYRVYEADNGEKGLQLAKEVLPDIIISDLMMQNGTGLELCAAIKTSPQTSHIPVILLTAVSSPEVKLQGVEGGADDYITKPFEKELLVARVKALLNSRSALQQYFYNEITLQKNDQKISAEYKEFLERCIGIVEAHLEDDDFTIKKLSQEIGMSHSNLYRKVKEISGQSVSSFIRFLRVRKAAELMIKSGMNVNEASFQVGISDVKYFRKQFQKLFGMNPSDYIKKYRQPFSEAYVVNKKLISPD